MKRICCVLIGKYRKFKNSETLHISQKTIVSIISSKCKNEDEKIFKNEESI